MKIWIIFFENKEKEREKKKKKRCVAQKEYIVTKKEGIFSVFSQTNWCFHCFEFHDLASWKTEDLETELRIFEN